jgi:hypothetical protein
VDEEEVAEIIREEGAGGGVQEEDEEGEGEEEGRKSSGAGAGSTPVATAAATLLETSSGAIRAHIAGWVEAYTASDQTLIPGGRILHFTREPGTVDSGTANAFGGARGSAAAGSASPHPHLSVAESLRAKAAAPVPAKGAYTCAVAPPSRFARIKVSKGWLDDHDRADYISAVTTANGK